MLLPQVVSVPETQRCHSLLMVFYMMRMWFMERSSSPYPSKTIQGRLVQIPTVNIFCTSKSRIKSNVTQFYFEVLVHQSTMRCTSVSLPGRTDLRRCWQISLVLRMLGMCATSKVRLQPEEQHPHSKWMHHCLGMLQCQWNGKFGQDRWRHDKTSWPLFLRMTMTQC